MLRITDALVWTGGDKAAPADILIDNDRIKAIVAPGATPAGEQVMSLAGCTVLPGLINAHVHLTMDGSPNPTVTSRADGPFGAAYKAVAAAEKTLRAGVTTVRDMGASGFMDIALRKAVAAGTVRGPRMLVSGECICMTGGHGWDGGCEVDGPDEARRGARRQLKAGADVIKIMATGGVMTPGVEPGSPQLTEEEMRAAVEEAHKAGKRTATHAQGTTGIKNAIRAGLDSIEHGIFLDDEAIQMMLDRGVYLVPTLVAPYHIVRGGIEAGIPAFAVEKSKRVIDSHVASFDKARRAGVKIAAGTDAGTPLNAHGTLALEIELMVKAGMPVVDALHAATSVAAACLGLEDRIGTIEPGKYADLLAVKGDPLADPSALYNVAAVWQGGVLVHQA
ncbi:MAG: amidohydrolase family protein [Chloroflexota bacterium]